MIKKKLENLIKEALEKLSIETEAVVLEHPEDFSLGDFSTSVALSCAKKAKMKPAELAKKIAEEISKNKPEEVERVEVAGPGFINFYLSKKFFAESIGQILKEGEKFGRNKTLSGEKILIEYTDPNPFKPFHIGHLMSNSIGESLSRIVEWNGAEVKRACYQGDVGLHVAKAIWGILNLKKEFPKKDAAAEEQISFIGRAYVVGAASYEDDEKAKKEITEINKKVYDKSDPEINKIYDWGRKVSLEHFEEIYQKLGTKFDFYFFESEMAPMGIFLVEEFLKKGIFEKSDLPSPSADGSGKASGAVIFPGEKYGLHTRVFINSQGLPTYEAKDIALNKKKREKYLFDRSIVITGNEQKEYYKVVLKALEFIEPSIANKTVHITHGLMCGPDGKKFSSRKGNAVTGESLLRDVEKIVEEKIKERELSPAEKIKIAEEVGVGAVKYSILKQSIGRDIIFDFEKSVSFEGDSGPYLQYAFTRANSVLEKSKAENLKPVPAKEGEGNEIEKLLYRFPEVVERARKEYSPSSIATYLVALASAFNSYYAKNKIIDLEKKEVSGHRLAITLAVKTVMGNGLGILGIGAPRKM